MAKYLFFDTNIFLHYQDVEKLKLEQRYGKGIVLVTPRVILGELDKHDACVKSYRSLQHIVAETLQIALRTPKISL